MDNQSLKLAPKRYRARNMSVTLAVVLSAVALCTVSPAQRFAYVGNYNSNNVSVFLVDDTSGGLTPISGSPFSVGVQPYGITSDSGGNFIYVANRGSNTISVFSRNPFTGTLTEISGSPFTTGNQPTSIAMDATGRYAFVTNVIDSNVYVYSRDSGTGALSFLAAYATGFHPFVVTVDTLNRFVYVANQDTADVSGFSFNSTNGSLATIPGSPFPARSRPRGIAVERTGQFAYVANYGLSEGSCGNGCNITAYSIDQTTGALSELVGSPYPAGTNPIWLLIDAQGHFLYTPNIISNDVTAYQINRSTGALTAIAGQPFFSGMGAVSIAMDPTNSFLVGANVYGDTVSSLRVDSLSGALLPSAGSPYGAGASFPIAVAVVGYPDSDSSSPTLFGNNTFHGNQTVLGSINASSFVGSGAGLTAVNASSLGGIAANNYARLDVGNSFTGNQTVNGSVAASAISGNGSGLTNLLPANIAAGTGAINITGNAATANSAINAANLGGVAATNYARVDVTNTFQANQSITGNLSTTGNFTSGGTISIGGGTPITKHISTLFPNVAFNTKLGPTTCLLWQSPASAADGDTVVAGLSATLMSSNIVYAAFFNAATATVTVRICNPTGAPTTIGSGNIRVDVWKH
jgi:6-phosphogluconolactonase